MGKWLSYSKHNAPENMWVLGMIVFKKKTVPQYILKVSAYFYIHFIIIFRNPGRRPDIIPQFREEEIDPRWSDLPSAM